MKKKTKKISGYAGASVTLCRDGVPTCVREGVNFDRKLTPDELRTILIESALHVWDHMLSELSD